MQSATEPPGKEHPFPVRSTACPPAIQRSPKASPQAATRPATAHRKGTGQPRSEARTRKGPLCHQDGVPRSQEACRWRGIPAGGRSVHCMGGRPGLSDAVWVSLHRCRYPEHTGCSRNAHNRLGRPPASAGASPATSPPGPGVPHRQISAVPDLPEFQPRRSATAGASEGMASEGEPGRVTHPPTRSLCRGTGHSAAGKEGRGRTWSQGGRIVSCGHQSGQMSDVSSVRSWRMGTCGRALTKGLLSGIEKCTAIEGELLDVPCRLQVYGHEPLPPSIRWDVPEPLA